MFDLVVNVPMVVTVVVHMALLEGSMIARLFVGVGGKRRLSTPVLVAMVAAIVVVVVVLVVTMLMMLMVVMRCVVLVVVVLLLLQGGMVGDGGVRGHSLPHVHVVPQVGQQEGCDGRCGAA